MSHFKKSSSTIPSRENICDAQTSFLQPKYIYFSALSVQRPHCDLLKPMPGLEKDACRPVCISSFAGLHMRNAGASWVSAKGLPLQVQQEGSFLSCCLTVKNCQRTLFFVPKEGEVSDDDGTLASLEEDAGNGPEQRAALLKHVHVGSIPNLFCTKVALLRRWA